MQASDNVRHPAESSFFQKVMLVLAGGMSLMGLGTIIGAAAIQSIAEHGTEYFWFSFLAFFGSAIMLALARSYEWSTGSNLFWYGASSITMGLFIGPVIGAFAMAVGVKITIAIFMGSAGVMALCALVVRIFSSTRFQGMESGLYWLLLATVIISLVSTFFFGGMNAGAGLLFALVGVAIAVGYMLVGFSLLRDNRENTYAAACEIAFLLIWAYVYLVLKIIEVLCWIAIIIGGIFK